MGDQYDTYKRRLKQLNVRDTVMEHRYDPKVQENTVLEVHYNGENVTKRIKSGFKVDVGGLVGLVVSHRYQRYLGNSRLRLPAAVGSAFEYSRQPLRGGFHSPGCHGQGPDNGLCLSAGSTRFTGGYDRRRGNDQPVYYTDETGGVWRKRSRWKKISGEF